MSAEATPAPSPQPGPDDVLLAERIQYLIKADDLDRQDRDLAAARRNVATQRQTLRARLDEIAAELRGRAAARTALASSSKDGQ